MSEAYQQYLKTLRRIPDDIVLAVASRDIIPSSNQRCICGWVIRESIARTVEMAADDVEAPVGRIISSLREQYGGSWLEWNDIFSGIVNVFQAHLIERAFVERVLEAVNA